MQRPGNINGLWGYNPQRTALSGYSGHLGTFGKSKGISVGMPGPPPGAAPAAPSGPRARFIGGKWVCSGMAPGTRMSKAKGKGRAKRGRGKKRPKSMADGPPPPTKDGYYHCCPAGWTHTGFQITRPCGKDYGQTVCGPIPEGFTVDDGVCCENLKEWAPNTTDGSDPCEALEQALMAQGKVVAGRAESMLAPELVIDQGPLISPTVMMVGGLAVAALFIVTIVIKLKS